LTVLHPFAFFRKGSVRGSQLLNVPATKTSPAIGESKEKIIFLVKAFLLLFMGVPFSSEMPDRGIFPGTNYGVRHSRQAAACPSPNMFPRDALFKDILAIGQLRQRRSPVKYA